MSRVFVRFPNSEMRERLTLEIRKSGAGSIYNAQTNSHISILNLSDEATALLKKVGAKIYENPTFEKFPGGLGPDLTSNAASVANLPKDKTINDVLEQIKAPQAWERSTGSAVTIAVVDSGVNGNRAEFAGKRSELDVPSKHAGSHWDDDNGHGTMCAAIACAKSGSGAKYNGVAPEAMLLSARTTFDSDDVYTIFEQLVLWKKSGEIEGPLVINCSFGLKACSASVEQPEDHPYLELVQLAVASGIVVVFAAGNNHRDVCKYDAKSHQPNTIWAANSTDDILCVGAVDWNKSNTDPNTPHSNSSRGPGQWSHERIKPDCVAPCYGDVLWGSNYVYLPWWGTSGAAPQVTGLAALLLSLHPELSPVQIGDAIRGSCEKLSGHEYCIGKGMINCYSAVGSA